MSIAAGGPTPVAATTSVPADSAGARAVAQARMAAVSTVRERDNDRDQPPVAYGVKGSNDTQEASTRYDARGKMSREDDGERGQRVDKRA